MFDSEATRIYTEVRQKFISKFVSEVWRGSKLKTALDVGCGVGYFSEFLDNLGFGVVAIDGRDQNIAEARRRYLGIDFICMDAESDAFSKVGVFDFVLCVGLLYHLENPFRAIRNLHAATGEVLFLESMIAPGSKPQMSLIDETRVEDQGLNHVAFYPTESCCVKMLYRSGFPHVYRFKSLPTHPLLRGTIWSRQQRTMLVASKKPLELSALSLVPDKRESWEMMLTGRERLRSQLDRAVGRARRMQPRTSGSSRK